MYLSVIIPAYNEEKRLPKTLKEIDKYLRQQNYEYEIIVVNDGSKDRTSEVVECLKPDIKHLRMIDNKINHGKGFVIRQGMLDAKGEYRVFTDADNSTSICHLEKMLPEFEKGYDIVIGSRDIKGAVLDPPQLIHRRILGDVFRLLTQIICGTWRILDSQCGFKGFTAKATEHIFPKCKINRFAFDPEILVLSQKLGFKIKEIPVVWKNDTESKVKFKSMLKMGLDLLKIRWNIITQKYD
ncbi:glycosyltransferase family 2 protein [Candidatus Parcubacteria bacterium]|nr:glycosyltransferase family 2 protein [Candidatus Parcubacteria bacterium]